MNTKLKIMMTGVFVSFVGRAFAQEPMVMVKIGSAAPTNSVISELGTDNENGAQLAVDDINAAGGLKIGGQSVWLQLVGVNDFGEAKYSPIAAQKLIDANVVAVVGHLNSGASIPANKVYAHAGLVQVSPSSTSLEYTLRSTLTPQHHQSAYRVIAHDGRQGEVIAQIIKSKGFRRVAVLSEDSSYGRGLSRTIIQNLPRPLVIDQATVSIEQKKFPALIQKWKKLKVDAVSFAGLEDEAAALVSQMKAQELNATLIGSDGVCIDRFVMLSGKSAEGALCVVGRVPLERMENGGEFSLKYSQAFGSNVQIYAPYAYDAVYAIVEAMKNADSTQPEEIAAAMPKVDFEGVTGRIRFDEKGDLRHGGLTGFVVKDGQLKVDDVYYAP